MASAVSSGTPNIREMEAPRSQRIAVISRPAAGPAAPTRATRPKRSAIVPSLRALRAVYLMASESLDQSTVL